MIKEAYCSYKVSNALKEKGFDEPCLYYYKDGVLMFSSSLKGRNSYQTNTCSAPTHQMAMAWLREVHNIFILVGWSPIHKEYFTRILNMTDNCPKRNIHEHADYEDAVEVAIKYCLENLI